MTLQELADSGSGTIRLPPDEYPGPLVISKPCTIDGCGATVWSESGPVVTVRAPGVTLENLRIEVTGDAADRDALVCEAPGTVLRNVEVYGSVRGVPEESGRWELPRTIDLGTFAAGERNVFVRHLPLPGAAAVRAELAGVQVEPDRLPAGGGEIRIVTDALRSGTCVYGGVFLDSALTRRIYIRGCAEAGAPVIMQASGRPSDPPARRTSPSPSRGRSAGLRRGERRSIAGEVEVRLAGAHGAVPDCYVFCLAADGKVRNDADLVFFGQPESPGGAVRLLAESSGPGAVFSLDKAPPDLKRFVVAFSCYDDVPLTGERADLRIEVAAADGTLAYPLTELGRSRTVSAVELYRRDNGWRLWVTDHRSRDGIQKLCTEYGVEVA